jgi:vacuolar-type H+-ATPase subunit C/Vma6
LRLDLALNREFARRAAAAVKRAPLGNAARRDLRLWVQNIIDFENAFTAIQLAAQRSSTDATHFFVTGGHIIDSKTFAAVAAAGSSTGALALLGDALRNSTIAPVFAALSTRPVEDAALDAELRRTSAAARRSPLGAAPIIAFLTRLRAEILDVRQLIWRVALGAPPAASGDLVTIV